MAITATNSSGVLGTREGRTTWSWKKGIRAFDLVSPNTRIRLEKKSSIGVDGKSPQFLLIGKKKMVKAHKYIGQ